MGIIHLKVAGVSVEWEPTELQWTTHCVGAGGPRVNAEGDVVRHHERVSG